MSYFRATAPDVFLTVLRRRAPDICRRDLLFRWEAAARRVEQAEFAPLENMWGQTDDRRIQLADNIPVRCMLPTLLHEAMHFLVYQRRVTRSSVWKELGADEEHDVMERIDDRLIFMY